MGTTYGAGITVVRYEFAYSCAPKLNLIKSVKGRKKWQKANLNVPSHTLT
jgi:hypothetical protein